MREQGHNGDPMHFTIIEGEGTVSGTILFAMDKEDFQRHELQMDVQRTITTYEAPFDARKGEQGEVRAILHQTDSSTTELRRAL